MAGEGGAGLDSVYLDLKTGKAVVLSKPIPKGEEGK
jgi:hypothetical protein